MERRVDISNYVIFAPIFFVSIGLKTCLLYTSVWDGRVDAFSNSIRVHISALRKKLRTALGYDPIRNRIGEGYEVGESEQ